MVNLNMKIKMTKSKVYIIPTKMKIFQSFKLKFLKDFEIFQDCKSYFLARRNSNKYVFFAL